MVLNYLAAPTNNPDVWGCDVLAKVRPRSLERGDGFEARSERGVIADMAPLRRGAVSMPEDAHCCSAEAIADQLSREVYCILGLAIDAIEMAAVVKRIEYAASSRTPYLISTPNLNFLVSSQQDIEFRESLLVSDLCTADGVPIVWIARLLGIPIRHTTSGSDLFEALKVEAPSARALKVFFFGATETVAAAAAHAVNTGPSTLRCIGWACPGFGSVDEFSQDRYIDRINSSGADILVAALSAKKGQLWLVRNHHRLRIPVRSHLGATINFQSGTVRRSPLMLRKIGLEWLWRIREEPRLWGRYWHDGKAFLRLMLSHVLPLAIRTQLRRRRLGRVEPHLTIDLLQRPEGITVSLSGFALAGEAEKAASSFRKALATKLPIVIDFSATHEADARFLGLLLMVRKVLQATNGGGLRLVGLSRRMKETFRLHRLDYLLREGSV